MSLHSTREQENDITGNYEHNGWNVKQTVRVVGALIATIVGVSLTQCGNSVSTEKSRTTEQPITQ